MARPTPCPFLPCAVLLLLAAPAMAQVKVLPPGFVDQSVGGTWNQPVGITFAADGRGFVWEKSGVVWLFENGQKSAQPLLDISEEVGDWSSKGMKGFAIDPDFLNNGYLYLLYAVDKHHLLYHGTPQYDPAADQYFEATIARITRYTANAFDDFHSVDPTSRRVLLGETITSGFPILDNHESGSLQFGNDGSLLASCGDGADGDGHTDVSLAIPQGILQPKEDVDNYRSQLVDCLNGKIIRIDPVTGDGLPDNPHYDPLAPRAPRSRVWLRGLRNPFSFRVVPSQYDPFRYQSPHRPWKDRHPGTILVGDVGANDWEEVNVAVNGGENFGWPAYEGMEIQPTHIFSFHPNLDAPNPLFNQDIPGVGLCTQEFFFFQDLLAQESLNPPSWPNPCDPTRQVPATALPSMHTRPVLDWHHDGPSRVKDFDAAGQAVIYTLGDPQSPVIGSPFGGNCSIAGPWYTGNSFPLEYRNTFFCADYAAGWIQRLLFDSHGNLAEVKDFGLNMGPIVTLTMNPVDGDLYYVFIEPGDVRRISYFPGNVPPTAVASATPAYGAEPLPVAFDGTASSDPEGQPLAYEWDFGNGTPLSRLPAPTRYFPSEDPTAGATILTKVRDELVPPQGTGPSSEPEVMRDDFYPGAFGLLKEQYTTFYYPFSAKSGVDWVGYDLGQTRSIHGLLFQEGSLFVTLGGWFQDVRVQVRSAGVWTDVPFTVDPPYGGNDGISFELHEFSFPPTQGDAVRLLGTPGGDWEFVSVAELRVLAAPLIDTRGVPTRHDVILKATDDTFTSSTAALSVWTENTPPQVSILSPVHGTAFVTPTTVPMTSMISDAEHSTGQLACEWRVSLHHEQHIHPEPVDFNCTTQFTLVPHNEGQGEVIYYEFKLTVIDPLGLATTRSAFLYPQMDCNLNGFDDATDISLGVSQDLDFNGIPDECEDDCNANLVIDSIDIVSGASADCNGNLIPDECDILNGTSLDLDANGIPDECVGSGSASGSCSCPETCACSGSCSGSCSCPG